MAEKKKKIVKYICMICGVKKDTLEELRKHFTLKHPEKL